MNVRPEKLTDERSRERVFGIRLRFVMAVTTVLVVIIGGFIMIVVLTPTNARSQLDRLRHGGREAVLSEIA